jgi:hypothetical protein
MNDDTFKFNNLKFDNDLKITNESKNNLVKYLNDYVVEIEYNNQKEFIELISNSLNLNDKNIGNTVDIYTTNKKIYQMCYQEFTEEPINFLATILNTKRKIVRGDVFLFSNSLLTTKIDEKDKALDYITQDNMTFDDVVNIILVNYYNIGLCFDGDKYFKFIFDNNMIIKSPENLKGIELSKLSFKRNNLLNFTIDLFYENEGDKVKDKYNKILGSFYLDNFYNKMFIAIKSETEKKYDSLLDDYIDRIINIYNHYCFDDDEMNIPKEFKFYDYQTNEKYTNKYIVFDNLYNKIVLSNKK